jgi:hypothetical protein
VSEVFDLLDRMELQRRQVEALERIADALEAKPAKTGPFAGIPLVYAWLPEAASQPCQHSTGIQTATMGRRCATCGVQLEGSAGTWDGQQWVPEPPVGPWGPTSQGEPVPFIDKPQRCYSEIQAIASAPDLHGLPIRCHLSQDHEGEHEANDGTSLFRWRVEGSTVICTPLAHPGEPKP